MKLFTSGKIGNLEIRNRVVMPAMETGLNSITGEVSDEIPEEVLNACDEELRKL